MWHAEADEAVADQIACSSQHFSKSVAPTWMARITLLYWSLKSRDHRPKSSGGTGGSNKTQSEVEKGLVKEDDTIFPPDDLGQPIKTTIKSLFELDIPSPIKGEHFIQRNASSIVLSTNGLGDFGKCSVVSALIDQHTRTRLSKSTLEVWNAFVHQPQTTRCLVFLILLGSLCTAVAEHYSEILEALTSKVDLGVSTTIFPPWTRWCLLTNIL